MEVAVARAISKSRGGGRVLLARDEGGAEHAQSPDQYDSV